MAKQKEKRSLFRKIINVLIGISIGITILLIIGFGFSQTKTFRDILRNEIVNEVNNNINGHLSIESIDGSIFTSVIVRNSLLTQQYDTLFHAEKIELKISPLQLLLKKIYIREIEISDLAFYLRETEKDKWNLTSLTQTDSINNLPGTETQPVHAETESSPFPFTIQVNDLKFSNIRFERQSYENLNSTSLYTTMNPDNFRVDSLNLSAKFIADLKKEDIQFVIQKLSFKPNFKLFALRELSGAFRITNSFAEVKKLTVRSDTTNLLVDARLDEINLFNPPELKDFKEYPLTLRLDAEPFNFNDLSSFLDDTYILQGQTYVNLETKGTFGDFDISRLEVKFKDSEFDITGTMKNLNDPKYLYIDAQIFNSTTHYSDVLDLLPFLELPVFENLNLTNYNATFKGEPTKFAATLKGQINEANVDLITKLNLQPKLMEYDVEFSTNNLDLRPVTGISSSITSQGKIVGKGVKPENLKADIRLKVKKSSFNSYSIDSLSFKTVADSRVINLDLIGNINDSRTAVNGMLNLKNLDEPIYNLTGSFKNLNLNSYLHNNIHSSLNLKFSADGKNLELDKLVGNFSLEFEPSQINNHLVDSASLVTTLIKEDDYREINVQSDFIDIGISGDFSLKNAIDLLTYEGNKISEIVSQKLSELNPIDDTDTTKTVSLTDDTVTDVVNKEINFEYEFTFKSFELIARLMGFEDLGISGHGSGEISNDSTQFSINTNVELNHFYTISKNKLIYISDLDAGINFSRDNRSLSFDNLFGSVSITSERTVLGPTFNSLEADLIFNQSRLYYNFFTELDTTLNVLAEGTMEMTPLKQTVNVNDLSLSYKNTTWANQKPISFSVIDDSISINHFAVGRDSSLVNISGYLTGYERQNFKIDAEKIPVELLYYYATDDPNSNISSLGSLDVDITGNLNNPELSAILNFDNIEINKNNFGNFVCNVKYENNTADLDVRFLDSLKNYDIPYLKLTGQVPFNSTSEDENDDSGKLDLLLESENFQLNTIGNIIPNINNQKGLLTSNVKISGSLSSPFLSGEIHLKNGFFLSEINNLGYKMEADVSFNGSQIEIDNISVTNHGGSRRVGTMTATGNINLDGVKLENIHLNVDGELAVLGFRSRSTSPTLYGNLFIGAGDTWEIKYSNNSTSFDGKILLKETDLVFAPVQSGYSASDDIIYEFKVDSSKIDKQQIKFERLVTGDNNGEESRKISQRIPDFNYNAEIEIEQPADIEIVLSQAFNQKLVAQVEGSLTYETSRGVTAARGEFNLLSGSKLEFFKVFDAEGSIKFEGSIADPYLDIVATYSADYTDPTDPNAAPQPVEVRLRIDSRFSELSQSLSTSNENLKVYIGQRNIANNSPDNRYSQLDALSFVLVGKFINQGFTSGDRQNLASTVAQNAANSILGQALTSLINSQVGDFVNDIRVNKYGKDTQINVSGRFENVRYSVGGNIEGENQVFNDISKANFKVEYLFNPNFLIRAERKLPVLQTSNTDERINELGLRYIFVF